MTDLTAWQQGNDRFLTAALAWLHLLLCQRAERSPVTQTVALAVPAPQAPPPAEPGPGQSGARPRFWWKQQKNAAPPEPERPPVPTVPLLPPALSAITDEQVAEARAAMDEAAAESEPPPALVTVRQRFGLSDFETNLLLLCAAVELDTRVAQECAAAQGAPERPYPTFALAAALFAEPAWDVLSTERPLRRSRLVEFPTHGAGPLVTSPLRADEWAVNYIKGLSFNRRRGLPVLDARLEALVTPVAPEPDELELPPSQRALVESLVGVLRESDGRHTMPVVQLLGPDAASKQLVARHVAAALGLQLYRLPAHLLPAPAEELELFARLWERTAVLLPVALSLDAQETEEAREGESRPAPPVSRFLARSDGVFILHTREAWPRLERMSLTHEVAKPTRDEQRAAWAAALGGEGAAIPEELSNSFSLSVAEIQRAARLALTGQRGDAPAPRERLWDICLAATRPRLDALARRIEPKATWDDIVLPDAEMKLLRQLADQVRQRGRVFEDWGFGQKTTRGRGVSALFAGESGTGKTMAAEVIANDLRLNLYQIDLSGVVSKYIGETEKNLRRLFDAAEDGGVILFFDEADAIFGKRSEVKDAHDRYANIETNYLLQRIEVYGGLAILATNMKDALDPAFTRRLRLTVDFPKPGPEERRAIWERVFPAETPVRDLDHARLARLELNGASIHSVALNAAFLAAAAGQPVTMSRILEAARGEFLKHGLPIREDDFTWREETGEEAAA